MAALSYYTDSQAPRDFRVESTESEGHFTKCPLCYQVKRSFYCTDCIKAGNFIHSSMPYSDRFSEKQAKLLRVKANRKYVLDRCEKLLEKKIKKDRLITEVKQSRDKLDLIRLAIEQRKNNVDQKKKELADLMQYNNELRLKLPRYMKRVGSLGKHAQDQRMELQNRVSTYHDQAHSLAALRRSRIRQLIKYIFPLYVSYDTSDSIEDMEFVWSDNMEDEAPTRSQLHIVAPWIETDSDFSKIQSWVSLHKESQPMTVCPRDLPAQRAAAALALLAQLLALLAWTLDLRPPPAHLPLSEYYSSRCPEGGVWWRARRVCACAAALAQRAALAPPSFPTSTAHAGPSPAPPARALLAVHAIAAAAAADDPVLGRVEGWLADSGAEGEGEVEGEGFTWAAAAAACGDFDEEELEPPEHLSWPETVEMEEAGSSPSSGAGGAGPASLVTSAAASLASMFRGWTK